MIEVLHLFPRLNRHLTELLTRLDDEQWARPTVCKLWTVKDIAAHLLDTAWRRLSIGRDNFRTPYPAVESVEALTVHLNALNASWVEAYRRVSPQILIRQLDLAHEELYGYLLTLDPDGEALFPVAWAGEAMSKNSFDIAREYTERWLHQQQIRQALGAPGLMDREYYHPFLETFMQALPHTFNLHKPDVPPRSVVRVDIVGTAGGSWTIIKDGAVWRFSTEDASPDAQVYIDEQIAWLLFSKGVDVMEARQFWQVTGDAELGSAALKMVSVMA